MLAVLATVWYVTARVWSDGTALHRRTLFGRVRTVPHADIALVVLAPRYRWLRFRSTGLLAFLDRNGDALLRLSGRSWTTDQLCAFAGVTGAPVDQRDDVERAPQLRADRPGALPYFERRPGVLWAIVGGCFVALFAAFLLILTT